MVRSYYKVRLCSRGIFNIFVSFFTFPACFATSMAASKHLSKFSSDMAAVDTSLVSPHRKDTSLVTDLKCMHAGSGTVHVLLTQHIWWLVKFLLVRTCHTHRQKNENQCSN